VASAGSRLVLTGVPGDPELPEAEVTESTLSGQRVVWQSRDAGGDLAWQLTDLTTKTTEPLPDAVSYDLWGERLVRLDADGSVWLHDLRTAADPEEISPAIDGGAETGTVHIAGDVVAWDVTPADPDAPDPRVLLQDVTTPDAAEQVTGLSVLHDLSTGYAAGCSADDECSPVAVSLADGSVTPVESDEPLAVDGNLLGYIPAEKLPAVRVLPPVDDQPRLLASPGAPATIDFARRTFSLRVTASQPLTTCAVQIRDEQDALVRSVPCSVTAYGAATSEWNGYGATFEHVPDGTYTWRIVAANGDRVLVDYDGSTAGLEGELVVDGPPDVVQVTPEPGDVAVRQDTGVTVQFDEPVTGVSSTTIRLHTATGAEVPGAVSYDAAGRTATITPHTPLNPMSRFTLTIEDGIADLRGNPLAETGWEEISFSTGTTSTAVQCSLVMPSKVVVDTRTERMGFRISSNCQANGADHASWDLIHTGMGFAAGLQFESADILHPDWYVDWSDTAPMGAWTLRPGGAGQADGNPLKQNTAALQVKYASRLAATVKRTTSALTWTATATQWSGSKHGWNTRARVTVGLFHQAPGSTTWKYVKSATTSSTGRATITLGSPKSGNYRLTVAETPTVWASYSTPVRGR
jgi:hypothetical protein